MFFYLKFWHYFRNWCLIKVMSLPLWISVKKITLTNLITINNSYIYLPSWFHFLFGVFLHWRLSEFSSFPFTYFYHFSIDAELEFIPSFCCNWINVWLLSTRFHLYAVLKIREACFWRFYTSDEKVCRHNHSSWRRQSCCHWLDCATHSD